MNPAQDLSPSYFNHDPAADRRWDRDYQAGRDGFANGHGEPKAYGHGAQSDAYRQGWWDARNGIY